ncbi:MAG: hypothetical protein M0Z36_14555 [Thermaerobacter sp.]|nr:hypothetical protein [Thermaerobacter sp.]
MNTRISYLYRDGGNYKRRSGDEVLTGTLSDERIADIRRTCSELVVYAG